jgi:hypothetical protein
MSLFFVHPAMGALGLICLIIVWVVYAVLVRRIIVKSYLRNGWKQVEELERELVDRETHPIKNPQTEIQTPPNLIIPEPSNKDAGDTGIPRLKI